MYSNWGENVLGGSHMATCSTFIIIKCLQLSTIALAVCIFSLLLTIYYLVCNKLVSCFPKLRYKVNQWQISIIFSFTKSHTCNLIHPWSFVVQNVIIVNLVDSTYKYIHHSILYTICLLFFILQSILTPWVENSNSIINSLIDRTNRKKTYIHKSRMEAKHIKTKL